MFYYGKLTEREIVELMKDAKIFIDLNLHNLNFNSWIYALCLGLKIIVYSHSGANKKYSDCILSLKNYQLDKAAERVFEFINEALEIKKIPKKVSVFKDHYYENKKEQLLEIIANR